MPLLFKNYSLVEVAYLFIRCNKTRFFLWNTNNTDRNGVNKQKTHTKHLENDNTGKRRRWGSRGDWGRVPTMDASECLFFDSAEGASNDVNTFLNLRFIKKQNRNQLFLRKYYMLTSSKLKRFHWMYLTLCRK